GRRRRTNTSIRRGGVLGVTAAGRGSSRRTRGPLTRCGLAHSCRGLLSGRRGRKPGVRKFQVIDYSLYAVHLRGIIGCRAALQVVIHTSAESNYSLVGVDRDLLVLNIAIGIDLALNVAGYLSVVAAAAAAHNQAKSQ